jgi:hypothetical protein
LKTTELLICVRGEFRVWRRVPWRASEARAIFPAQRPSQVGTF